MIKFNRVEIRDFFSFEHAALEFPENGLVLILGQNEDSTSASSNGSGKSTIVESIVFGLFGRTIRPGLSASDVIRRGTESCRIILEFESDGHQYKIDRVQKLRTTGTLELICDGKMIATGKKEAQGFINTVVGIDAKLFCQSIILGQDSLAFATSTDSERKALLEKMLGAEAFEGYRKAAQVRCDEIDLQATVLANTIASYTSLLAAEKRHLVDSERAKEEFEKMKRQAIDSIRLLVESSLKAVQDLESTQDKIGMLLQLQERLSATVNSPENATVQKDADLAREKWSSAKTRLEIAQRDYNSAVKEQNAISDKCPTCGRDYDGESIEQSRFYAKGKVVATKTAIDEAQQALNLTTQEMAEVKRRLLSFESSRNDLVQAQREMAGLQARSEMLEMESKKLAERQKRLVEEEGKQFTDNGNIELIKGKIVEIQGRIATDEKQRANLLDEKPYYEFWVRGWSNKGLKSFIFDSVLGFLNTRANEYSNVLTDGEIEIIFKTQKELKSGDAAEEFTVTGINRYGANVYQGQSSGERERVDLAIALALQDLARSRSAVGSNLMVLDECCTHVDALGADRMFTLLQQLKQQKGRSIIFITHKDELKDMFEECIVVSKRGGISRVEN